MKHLTLTEIYKTIKTSFLRKQESSHCFSECIGLKNWIPCQARNDTPEGFHMKKLFFLKKVTLNLFQGLMVSIFILLLTNTASAFDSGSTGALGAFNPQTNIEVDISLYPDGKLNYTTVNIPAGVTVTFKKNANNTPVYILATGNVTIAGTISVNGTAGGVQSAGKGGPGGFDGGLGGDIAIPGGKALGPGAGNPGSVSSVPASYCAGGGGGGGFGSNGSNGDGNSQYAPGGSGGGKYGDGKLLPMIGGSGGGGGAGHLSTFYQTRGGGGGGGSGAILIASGSSSTIGTITVTGSITANGGNGANNGQCGGGGGAGSGGAIKLMADTISVSGTISASGGAGSTSPGGYGGGAGGNGIIRFEANTVTGNTTPPYTYSHPGTVFVTNMPTLTITSAGGVSVPANPSGKYGFPDVTLPSTTTNPVTVNVSATNIPVGTHVTVTAVPEYGASASAANFLSGTDASSTTSISVTLSTTYQSILTATATYTIQQAMYWDDEKIEKVRVATTIGKGSEVTYITEKGKEIKSGELMAKLMGW